MFSFLSLKATILWLLANILLPFEKACLLNKDKWNQKIERDITSARSLPQNSQLWCKISLFCLWSLQLYFQHFHPKESYILQWDKHTNSLLQLEKTLSHINLHNSSYICSPIAYYFLSYCPHYYHIKSFALSYTPFTFSIYVILPTVLYINAFPSQSPITFPLKHQRILCACPLVDLTLFQFFMCISDLSNCAVISVCLDLSIFP